MARKISAGQKILNVLGVIGIVLALIGIAILLYKVFTL